MVECSPRPQEALGLNISTVQCGIPGMQRQEDWGFLSSRTALDVEYPVWKTNKEKSFC